MNGQRDFQEAAPRRLAEAASWRVRLTEAGLHRSPEFEQWIGDEANQAAWDQVSRAWTIFDSHVPELSEARTAALKDAQNTRTGLAGYRKVRRLVELIAAVMLVAAIGAGGYFWLNRSDEYTTAAGERRVITLADGSKLSLDTNSDVTVRYGKRARDLRLLKGQARFDVAHDKTRPFSVLAGNQKIIATGTAFNIDIAGPEVLVTLIEGHVVVLGENESAAVQPWPHRIELRAGQQLAATASAAPQVTQANIRKTTAWTRGQIVFDDEALYSVVERINRYGSTQVVIADRQVGAMKISGVLNAGDVQGFIDIVTHYLPVKATSVGPNTIAFQKEKKKSGPL
jgi:transmembrane sensor